MAKVIAVTSKEIMKMEQVKTTNKSNKLVMDKFSKDLERVIDLMDQDGSGMFTINQVGSILNIFKVFKQLCSSRQAKNQPACKLRSYKI